MNLQSGDSVNHVRSRIGEFPRPVDVVFLIETRLDLHQNRNLFPVSRRGNQRLDNRRVAADPVQGLLDRKNIRIRRRLLQKPDDRIE